MMNEKTLEFDAQGKAMIETRDGVSIPVELTFNCVNNFVHHPDVHFEELQWLCLGLVNCIDELRGVVDKAEDTQGFEPAGAVVLRDGLPLTIDDVLKLLNKRGN